MHNFIAIIHLLGLIIISMLMNLSPGQFVVLYFFSSISNIAYAEGFYRWKKENELS